VIPYKDPIYYHYLLFYIYNIINICMATASFPDLLGAYSPAKNYWGLTNITLTSQDAMAQYGLRPNGRGVATLAANKCRMCGLLQMVTFGDNILAKDDSSLGNATGITITAPKNLQQKPNKYTSATLPKTEKDKSALIDRLIVLAADPAPGNKQDRLKIDVGPKSYKLSELLKVSEFGGKAAPPAGSIAPPTTQQQEKVTRSIFKILLSSNGYNPPAGDLSGGFVFNDKSAAGIKDAITLSDFNDFCQGKKPKGYSGPKVDLNKDWPSIGKIAEAGLTRKKNKDGKYTGTVNLNATDNPTVRGWYWNFFIQFKNIKNDRRLKNDSYTEFNRDGGFMDFISELIKAGPREFDTKSKKLKVAINARKGEWKYFGEVTEKDSWNPADIWLIKNKPATEFNEFILKIKNAQTVQELNNALIDAHKEKIIVGVSLKKSNVTTSGAGNMEYELVNLTKHKHRDLPTVEYDDWPLEFDWQANTGTFGKTSNALYLKFKGERIAHLDLASSATGVGNLKIQFTSEQGSAALGRVPKPGFERLLNKFGVNTLSIPEWMEVEDSLPFTAAGLKNGAYAGRLRSKQGEAKKPDDKNEIDIKTKAWLNKFEYINSSTGKQIISGDINKLTNTTLKQIIKARNSSTYKDKSKSQKDICIALQILDMANIFVKVYNKQLNPDPKSPALGKKQKFSLFMRTLYYFAQKKGAFFTSRFGPFGKLH